MIDSHQQIFPRLGREPFPSDEDQPAIRRLTDTLTDCRLHLDRAIQENSAELSRMYRALKTHCHHDPSVCQLAARGPVFSACYEGMLAGARKAKELCTPLLSQLQSLIERVPSTIDRVQRGQFHADLLSFEDKLEDLETSLDRELSRSYRAVRQLLLEQAQLPTQGSKQLSYEMVITKLHHERIELARVVEQIIIQNVPSMQRLYQAAAVYRLPAH